MPSRLLLLLAGVVAGVIAVTQAERKIPVQYAQRAVGRKIYSGGSSFLPLRVNFAGVMPIIFARAILMVPQQMLSLCWATFIPACDFLERIGQPLVRGHVHYIWSFTVDDPVLLLFLDRDAIQ